MSDNIPKFDFEIELPELSNGPIKLSNGSMLKIGDTVDMTSMAGVPSFDSVSTHA